MTAPPPLRFTASDAEAAYDTWGCNCGPGTLAAALGLTLDEVHALLPDFDARRWTGPTMMWRALRDAGAKWNTTSGKVRSWPTFGLARVQWHGPWTAPGVPARVAYRHTHWVGACYRSDDDLGIFDINAMSSGGWIAVNDWAGSLVPWLLKQCEPKADGRWSLTHSVEIERN